MSTSMFFWFGGQSQPLRFAYSRSMMEYVCVCVFVCVCAGVSTINSEYITSTHVMITIHVLSMILFLVMPTLFRKCWL